MLGRNVGWLACHRLPIYLPLCRFRGLGKELSPGRAQIVRAGKLRKYASPGNSSGSPARPVPVPSQRRSFEVQSGTAAKGILGREGMLSEVPQPHLYASPHPSAAAA